MGSEVIASQPEYRAWLAQLSADLMREFPEVTGFSVRNLKYIRQWYLFWQAQTTGQQAVAPFGSQPATPNILTIPWGHNLAIITQCKQHELVLVLIEHITQFLLVLGTSFAYIGRQVPLQVGEGDQPTIGLLLCKSKDRLVAEYALSDIQKPMGLATYTLSHTLPEALQGKLPSIEQLERELGLDVRDGDLGDADGSGV